MPRPAVVCLVLVCAALACERPSERTSRDREMAGRVILRGLAYPGSVVTSYVAGEDAAEIVFTVPASPEQILGWYREALRLNGWELRNEARESDGTVVLYAQQGPRPLWVRLRGNVGGPGTTYSVIGAEVAGDTMR